MKYLVMLMKRILSSRWSSPTKKFQANRSNLGLFFPIFNNELLTKDDVDLAVEEIDDTSSITIQLQKLLVDDVEESSSSSLSEAYEFDCQPAGIFCMWGSKPDVYSPLTKSKKSRSIGSGSRRWRIRNLLRQSHNEGTEDAINDEDDNEAASWLLFVGGGSCSLNPSSKRLSHVIFIFTIVDVVASYHRASY